MKNIFFAALIAALLSGCGVSVGGGYRPMVYAPAPIVVSQYGGYQQSSVPAAVMQGRNPCSAQSGVANVVAGAVVGAAVGALLGNNHRAAGFGAGVGLLSGGAAASAECQQYLAWVAENMPRVQREAVAIQRYETSDGRVVEMRESYRETQYGRPAWVR